jgi:hypothetical protein
MSIPDSFSVGTTRMGVGVPVGVLVRVLVGVFVGVFGPRPRPNRAPETRHAG